MSNSTSTGPNGQPLLTSPVPLSERGVTEFALCVVLMFISTIAVILRLWARKLKGRAFAPDDYIIIAALIFLYGNGISECVAVVLGGRGRHMNELSPDVVVLTFKALFAAAISWTFSTSAIKLSLLLLYIRVFPQRSFRLAAYAMMGVVTVYCAGCFIFYMGNCRPIQANWMPNLPGSVCGNQHAGWLGTGIANILTDLAVLSMPMRSVYTLQLPRRTKAAVAAIFGIGFITLAVSIARLVALFQIDLNDFTYTTVLADILSAFEPALMITAACLPIMRPLFNRLLPSNIRSKYARSKYGRNNYHPDRTISNNHGRASYRANVHLKQFKGRDVAGKHKSIGLTGQDGFTRLPDVESKIRSVDSDETDLARQGRDAGDKPTGTATIVQSRSESPSQSRREQDRSHTPTPPFNRIEVTREWTVQSE